MKKIKGFDDYINEAFIPDKLILYHSTGTDNMVSILKDGAFIPGKSDASGQSWKSKYAGIGTYFHQFFPQHELAHGYDESGPYTVTFKIRVPFNKFTIEIDEDSATGDESESVKRQMISDGVAVVVIAPRIDIIKDAELEAIYVPGEHWQLTEYCQVPERFRKYLRFIPTKEL